MTATSSVGEEELGSNFEQQLFSHNEIFVYQIPPRQMSTGHSAGTWGALDSPALTGHIKVYRKGDNCYLRLYEVQKNHELLLFAESPICLLGGKRLESCFEAVTDSSRYFVCRVEDAASKKHAFIGIGFRDRQAAFDLKATLQDYERSIRRQETAAKLRAEQQEAGPSAASGTPDKASTPQPPTHDYSLKAPIHVNLKSSSGQGRARKKTAEPSTQGGGGLLGLRPPPPPPGPAVAPPAPDAVTSTPVATETPAAAAAVVADDSAEDDDWGSFTQASS